MTSKCDEGFALFMAVNDKSKYNTYIWNTSKLQLCTPFEEQNYNCFKTIDSMAGLTSLDMQFAINSNNSNVFNFIFSNFSTIFIIVPLGPFPFLIFFGLNSGGQMVSGKGGNNQLVYLLCIIYIICIINKIT